ncbi:MAG: hypothetical protein MZV70_32930 [Desulfobacterales bacterium]|nr:hypothetical protein [Desulfobacterales bacterium]
MIVRLHDHRGEIKERATAFHSFVKTEMTWDAAAAKILHIAADGIHGMQQRRIDSGGYALKRRILK